MKRILFLLSAAIFAPLVSHAEMLSTSGSTAIITEAGQVNLQLGNIECTKLLGLYGKLTGKRMIWDNTVQGNMFVNLNETISKPEAIDFLDHLFIDNGFVLIDRPNKLVEVAGISKNPRQFGVPVYSSPEEVPQNERVVSCMFHPKYRAAKDVLALMQQYIAPSPYTAIAAFADTNTLLVTEWTSVIRNLQIILKEIDQPGDKTLASEKSTPAVPSKATREVPATPAGE